MLFSYSCNYVKSEEELSEKNIFYFEQDIGPVRKAVSYTHLDVYKRQHITYSY